MARENAWSINTTLRSPDRLQSYVSIAGEMQGRRKDLNFEKDFFFETIQRGLYQPNTKDSFWKEKIKDGPQENNDYIMTKDELLQLMSTVHYKNKSYDDDQDQIYAFRGRTAFAPLTNFGFVRNRDISGNVKLTPLGEVFIKEDQKHFENIYLRLFLKWQLDNPNESNGFNIKPFIATLKVIDGVNKEWVRLGNKAVGINRNELRAFIPTLVDYRNITTVVNEIIEYRQQVRSRPSRDQHQFEEEFLTNRVVEVFNLQAANEKTIQTKKNNLRDYADSAIRYFRETGMLYYRGEGYYIDIAPTRRKEAENIVNHFSASCDSFANSDEYIDYLSDINQPDLPWETTDNLKEIFDDIVSEFKTLNEDISSYTPSFNEQTINYSDQWKINDLKRAIDIVRSETRQMRYMQVMLEDQNFKDLKPLATAISELTKKRDRFSTYTQVTKPSIRLEWLFAESLLAIGQANSITPNYNTGDDGIPLYTAKGNVPDLMADYNDFNLIGEVTMLQSRDQWINEGQPVMRHLSDAVKLDPSKPTYGLFIAPSLHRDTLNTYFFGTKMNFEGTKLKLIPLTFNDYSLILSKIYSIRESGGVFTQKDFANLLENLNSAVDSADSSINWVQEIQKKIEEFIQ